MAWRAQALCTALSFRSSRRRKSPNNPETTVEEPKATRPRHALDQLLRHPSCQASLHALAAQLKPYLDDTHRHFDLRCDAALDELYQQLTTNLSARDCLRRLPLEVQIVLLTHTHQSCRALERKGVARGDFDVHDVEYVLPTTLGVARALTMEPYWRGMVQLSVQYALGTFALPDTEPFRQSPVVKGEEAVLRLEGDHNALAERACLSHNLQRIGLGDVPRFVLTSELRVFSDQDMDDRSASPQTALGALLRRPTPKGATLEWRCGLVWAHTYPFWKWEGGSVRLDIRVPAGAEAYYTRFNETHLFTPLHDRSKHATIMLPPGRLTVTGVDRVRRPPPSGEGATEATRLRDPRVTVVHCVYTPTASSGHRSNDVAGTPRTPQSPRTPRTP